MLEIFRRVFDLFRRKPAPEPVQPPPPPFSAVVPSATTAPFVPFVPFVPELPKPPSNKASRAKRRQTLRLKNAILDHLDDHTKIMGRMQKCFPSEYGIYSQVGAVLVPHDDAFLNVRELMVEPFSPWFKKVRPGFGAVVTGIPKDEHKTADALCHPRLCHFLKIEHPSAIQRQRFGRRRELTMQPIAPGSDLYLFTFYYDEKDWARVFPKKNRRDRKICRFFEDAFAYEIPVEVTKDGHVRALRIVRERQLRFRHNEDPIFVREWDYPYSKAYLSHFKKAPFKGIEPEAFIFHEVGVVIRAFEEATSSIIQVRATKNGITTLVNVDVENTPRFFDDRDDTIIDGVKKRIFHIVRPHDRVGTRGVKLSFRGLRKFVWRGYEIEISVPGRDHFDVKEWDVTSVEDDGRPDAIDNADLGRWLVDSQRARAGAWVKPGQFLPKPPLARSELRDAAE